MFVIAMFVTVSSVQINHKHRNSTALQLNKKVLSCCSLLLIPQLLLFGMPLHSTRTRRAWRCWRSRRIVTVG